MRAGGQVVGFRCPTSIGTLFGRPCFYRTPCGKPRGFLLASSVGSRVAQKATQSGPPLKGAKRSEKVAPRRPPASAQVKLLYFGVCTVLQLILPQAEWLKIGRQFS